METKRKKRLATGLIVLMLGVFGFTSIGFASYSAGKARVKNQVRAYNTKNKRTRGYVEGATISLYTKAGELVQRGTSSVRWGKTVFSNVGKGKYYVTCSKTGYVSSKNSSKTVYKTGSIKVKKKGTASGVCKLRKAN
jgi:uncharacterized surface anchored protein